MDVVALRNKWDLTGSLEDLTPLGFDDVESMVNQGADYAILADVDEDTRDSVILLTNWLICSPNCVYEMDGVNGNGIIAIWGNNKKTSVKVFYGKIDSIAIIKTDRNAIVNSKLLTKSEPATVRALTKKFVKMILKGLRGVSNSPASLALCDSDKKLHKRLCTRAAANCMKVSAFLEIFDIVEKDLEKCKRECGHYFCSYMGQIFELFDDGVTQCDEEQFAIGVLEKHMEKRAMQGMQAF